MRARRSWSVIEPDDPCEVDGITRVGGVRGVGGVMRDESILGIDGVTRGGSGLGGATGVRVCAAGARGGVAGSAALAAGR